MTEAAAEDINHIVKFLRQHIRYVNESGSENLYKYRAIQSIIKDPHSGLSRVEANYVISKLFSQKTGKKSKNNSPTKPGSPNLKSFSNDFVARSTCKTNFNTHELSEAVFEARKLSLMRGILEEVDSDSLQSLILQKLEAGLMEFTNNESGTEKSSLNFLPVASCFKVLQEAKELRLNRAQIMFIISWADCFDKDGASLDIRKFAEHAANIVEQISIPEVMDTRAEVVYHGKIDGKRVMNGLKEKDLYRYLEYQFSNRASNGEISVDELKTVLRSAPRINLSEREAVTIVSSIDTAGSKVNCKEVLSTLVNSVFTLCRERMINRRVSLVVTSQLLMQNGGIETKQSMRLQTNSIKTLKDVAERLLNFAKIVREDQNIFVRFPKDELHQGSSSNLLYDDAVNMSEVSVLFRGAMMIPLVKLVSNNFGSSGNDVGMMRSSSGIDLSAANRILSTASRELLRASTVSGSTKVSSSPISPAKRGMSLSRSNSRVVPFSVPAEKISGKIAGFIRIISTEDSAGNVTLTASIISVDLDYQVYNKLEVKLPSIGLVDKEVAVQIASNVAEKMYLELSSFNQMTLKLYQEETVED